VACVRIYRLYDARVLNFIYVHKIVGWLTNVRAVVYDLFFYSSPRITLGLICRALWT
jgi:hypothetical protein